MPPSPFRIAFTGASGFIGGRFLERALAEGIDGRPAQALALTHGEAGADALRARHPGLEAAALPLLPDEALRDRLRGTDALVHAGWSSVPAEAERDPIGDLRTNVGGSIRLYRAAIEAGVARIVFLSSGGTVYGEPRVLPIAEDHPLAPRSAYGAAKACAEAYLLAMARATATQALVLRPANVYGRGRAHDKPQGVVEHWLMRIASGEDLVCWNDPAVVRDYVHVDDMTAALLAAVHRPMAHAVLNVGTGVGTSLQALAEAMARVTGRAARIVHGHTRHPALSVNVLDPTRMKEALGFAPAIGLEEGLRLTWRALHGRD